MQLLVGQLRDFHTCAIPRHDDAQQVEQVSDFVFRGDRWVAGQLFLKELLGKSQ